MDRIETGRMAKSVPLVVVDGGVARADGGEDRIKEIALGFALTGPRSADHHLTVLERARAFEAYLRGAVDAKVVGETTAFVGEE